MEWLSHEGLRKYGLSHLPTESSSSLLLSFAMRHYCSIRRSGLRNISLDEFLQAIIFKKNLHPVLPGYIVRVSLKCILQPQPIEIYFNVYSIVAPRNSCSKFKFFHQHKNSAPLHNCNLQELTLLRYHVEIIYIKHVYIQTLLI